MDGFWIADTHGSLLEVNETYCRMSGYAAAEVNARIRKIVSRGEDRFETRHRREDGIIYDVVSARYLQENTPFPPTFCGHAADVALSLSSWKEVYINKARKGDPGMFAIYHAATGDGDFHEIS
jgi:PAS domain-containing protein